MKSPRTMAELGVWDRGSGEGFSALKTHTTLFLFSSVIGQAYISECLDYKTKILFQSLLSGPHVF